MIGMITLIRPLSFDLSGMGGPARSYKDSRQHSSVVDHGDTQALEPIPDVFRI